MKFWVNSKGGSFPITTIADLVPSIEDARLAQALTARIAKAHATAVKIAKKFDSDPHNRFWCVGQQTLGMRSHQQIALQLLLDAQWSAAWYEPSEPNGFGHAQGLISVHHAKDTLANFDWANITGAPKGAHIYGEKTTGHNLSINLGDECLCGHPDRLVEVQPSSRPFDPFEL